MSSIKDKRIKSTKCNVVAEKPKATMNKEKIKEPAEISRGFARYLRKKKAKEAKQKLKLELEKQKELENAQKIRITDILTDTTDSIEDLTEEEDRETVYYKVQQTPTKTASKAVQTMEIGPNISMMNIRRNRITSCKTQVPIGAERYSNRVTRVIKQAKHKKSTLPRTAEESQDVSTSTTLDNNINNMETNTTLENEQRARMHYGMSNNLVNNTVERTQQVRYNYANPSNERNTIRFDRSYFQANNNRAAYSMSKQSNVTRKPKAQYSTIEPNKPYTSIASITSYNSSVQNSTNASNAIYTSTGSNVAKGLYESYELNIPNASFISTDSNGSTEVNIPTASFIPTGSTESVGFTEPNITTASLMLTDSNESTEADKPTASNGFNNSTEPNMPTASFMPTGANGSTGLNKHTPAFMPTGANGSTALNKQTPAFMPTGANGSTGLNKQTAAFMPTDASRSTRPNLPNASFNATGTNGSTRSNGINGATAQNMPTASNIPTGPNGSNELPRIQIPFVPNYYFNNYRPHFFHSNMPHYNTEMPINGCYINPRNMNNINPQNIAMQVPILPHPWLLANMPPRRLNLAFWRSLWPPFYFNAVAKKQHPK